MTTPVTTYTPELAERLGVPVATVERRMFAGVGRLRELLAEP